MNLRNCIKCGKLFVRVHNPICPDCTKEEETNFELVKKYLFEHPNSTAAEVAEETGVSLNAIKKYLNEGRLVATAGMKDFLKCESCGKTIASGSYCNECIIKLDKAAAELVKENTAEKNKNTGPKMHTYDMRKDKNKPR